MATILYFVMSNPLAQRPVKGSLLAAGYDLTSVENTTVCARGSAMVSTGVKVMLPLNTYGRIAPRSGLAWRHKIDVGGGVIDEDYRGDIQVVLFNHSDVDFHIGVGDRIAQLIIVKIEHPQAIQVEALECSERGAGGFGSTDGP